MKPWPGVACDEPAGNVIGLDLSSKGLGGQLDTSLAQLDTLRSIDLHNNSCSGDLPAAWSTLQLLDYLDVSSNILNGTLPPAYGGMGGLQHLDASRNQLHGTLPAAWSGMALLEMLDLSHNQLTSSLPASWARLSFLSSLSLRNNSIEGTLPAAWLGQTQLLQLDIADNQLKGALPDNWAKGMDSLRSANMSNNSISGALPYQWANLTSLQSLAVDSNKLSGKIPATWRSLPLHSLHVSKNDDVCGDVPVGVNTAIAGGATRLNSSCPWDADADVLLAFKANLTDPKGAMASWQPRLNPCGATRTWAGIMCDSDGRVMGVRLEHMGLQGRLSGQLPQVSRLAEIYLAGNELSGTLPSEWSQQPRLVVIDVSQNRLEGPLPDAWGGALSSLQRLDASGNEKLNGTLPGSWGLLGALQILSLQGNSLEGSLPDAWAAASLRVLQLDDNRLNGTLPSRGLPSSLREISLRGNTLEGQVPSGLKKSSPQLTYLNLEGNQQMCGQVPPMPTDLTVRTGQTGLGSQCRSDIMSKKTSAIIAGATVGACCLAFVAAIASVSIVRKRLMAQQKCNVGHHGDGAATAIGVPAAHGLPAAPVDQGPVRRASSTPAPGGVPIHRELCAAAISDDSDHPSPGDSQGSPPGRTSPIPLAFPRPLGQEGEPAAAPADNTAALSSAPTLAAGLPLAGGAAVVFAPAAGSHASVASPHAARPGSASEASALQLATPRSPRLGTASFPPVSASSGSCLLTQPASALLADALAKCRSPSRVQMMRVETYLSCPGPAECGSGPSKSPMASPRAIAALSPRSASVISAAEGFMHAMHGMSAGINGAGSSASNQ